MLQNRGYVYSCYGHGRRRAAILVHDACTLADTTVGLANVVKTALLQPRKTQNGVLGHAARIGGSAAFVCQTNGRRYPNGRAKTG